MFKNSVVKYKDQASRLVIFIMLSGVSSSALALDWNLGLTLPNAPGSPTLSIGNQPGFIPPPYIQSPLQVPDPQVIVPTGFPQPTPGQPIILTPGSPASSWCQQAANSYYNQWQQQSQWQSSWQWQGNAQSQVMYYLDVIYQTLQSYLQQQQQLYIQNMWQSSQFSNQTVQFSNQYSWQMVAFRLSVIQQMLSMLQVQSGVAPAWGANNNLANIVGALLQLRNALAGQSQSYDMSNFLMQIDQIQRQLQGRNSWCN